MADVGEDPRLGSVMKLTGNFNIASIVELIGEGMTLGERSGLSRDHLLQFYSFMLPGEASSSPPVQINWRLCILQSTLCKVPFR